MFPHLDVIFVPGIPPQAEGGDAGQEAAEDGAAEGGAAEAVGVLTDQTGGAPGTGAAWTGKC